MKLFGKRMKQAEPTGPVYRQGDVLLVPLEHAPKPATPVMQRPGRLILAEGEATGHAHAILDDAAELVTAEWPRRLYLIVGGTRPVELVHEEHATLLIEPGTYEVRRQREYSPDEIRRVPD